MTGNKSHLGETVVSMPEAPPTLPQTIADLRAAADLLEQDGWCQGTWHPADGAHCVGHALYVVTARAETEEAKNRRLNRVIYAFAAHVGMRAITAWNDAEGRTQEQVITALRGAADGLESGR